MEEYRLKFQELLRQLFQFDCADLDFGIYRIMNYKRDAIEQFITKDLPQAISTELDRGALAEQSQAARELEEVTKQIEASLGRDALDAEGNLANTYHATPLGQKYLGLKAAASGGRGREALEATIFNHLHTFFSRYYQDGDFISKRRYSKRQKYAIPYNGEEVNLYWANNDQYYIKTAEHFHDYTFTSRGVTVHFKLREASVEQNNVKGDKRFFLPHSKEIEWDDKASQVIIPFDYRPLTEQEAITYGKQNQQDAIIAEALEEIPKQIKKVDRAVAALAAERRKNGSGEPVTVLEHHLRQYTRRNTSDFFIHKNLKGFLSLELDFYLKNEVLNLDEMEAAGEGRAEAWFQIMGVIKAIGGRIIDFLAQIENFQKMLWEKRKLVTETQYCITVGNISQDFYPEIAACDPQWVEWKELFHIDEEQTDLFTNGKSKKDRRIAFLKNHPTLVLDTKHFDPDFVDRLLEGFDDIDGITDGLLIYSENFQALRLLLEKYRASVKTIYIDPPYNSPSSEIIYKNGYKHSSWLSLIHSRMLVSQGFMLHNAVHVLAIDENELERVSLMLRSCFKDMKHTTVTIVHNPSGQQSQNFSYCHDYACFTYSPDGRQIGEEIREDTYDERNFRDVTGEDSKREAAKTCFYPIFVRDGKIVGFGDVCEPDYHPGSMNLSMEDGSIAVYPIDPQGVERKWRFSRSTVETIVDELFPHFLRQREEWDIKRRKNTFNFKTVWTGAKYSGNNHGTQLLNQILGTQEFDYPKSIYTVVDCLRAALNEDSQSLILDYFAGSGTTGHAVIHMNREDGGSRRFILAEMGHYFDTVLLPRIKKVTFTPDWKESKPERMATDEEAKRSPRIVKYIRIESYEDALNNIEFDDASKQAALKFDDYLFKYMLQWETRKSETLLNVEKLASPFHYTLHIHKDGQTREKVVDMPETFNYLLGLQVRTRHTYRDGDRRYVVYRGDIDHRRVVVIWRETKDWKKKDYEQDKKFVAAHNLTAVADEVFVNGDSFIPGAKSLDSIFKARMFAEV